MLNKFVYYLLSFTWGLPMTLLGSIISLILIICGHRPHKWLYGYYFVIGHGWGGLELGPFFLVSDNVSRRTLNHEFGHGIQNCFFGPLMPFMVSIPSAIRYWYREFLVKKKGYRYSDLPDYDSIWFEGQATNIGNKYDKALNS